MINSKSDLACEVAIKQKGRKEIIITTREYIKNGGKINLVPRGVTNQTNVYVQKMTQASGGGKKTLYGAKKS